MRRTGDAGKDSADRVEQAVDGPPCHRPQHALILENAISIGFGEYGGKSSNLAPADSTVTWSEEPHSSYARATARRYSIE